MRAVFGDDDESSVRGLWKMGYEFFAFTVEIFCKTTESTTNFTLIFLQNCTEIRPNLHSPIGDGSRALLEGRAF